MYPITNELITAGANINILIIFEDLNLLSRQIAKNIASTFAMSVDEKAKISVFFILEIIWPSLKTLI